MHIFIPNSIYTEVSVKQTTEYHEKSLCKASLVQFLEMCYKAYLLPYLSKSTLALALSRWFSFAPVDLLYGHALVYPQYSSKAQTSAYKKHCTCHAFLCGAYNLMIITDCSDPCHM